MNQQNTYGDAFVSFIVVAFFGLLLYGYIVNIIDIFYLSDLLTGEGVLRIVGIFVAPLGIIMGLFV